MQITAFRAWPSARTLLLNDAPNVHADRLDTGGALGSELVEERVEGGGVLALSAPHDLLGGVVGDQGEVVVVAFPGSPGTDVDVILR